MYLSSEEGKKAIELFTNGHTNDILEKYLGTYHFDVDTTASFIDDLCEYCIKPTIPAELDNESAELFYKEIIKNGIAFQVVGEPFENYDPKKYDYLKFIPVISTWLFFHFPDFYKPYFFNCKFSLLTQIADTLGIELPEVPLKKYKEERIIYYWKLCLAFLDFQQENDMSPYEFCAFLYDFAPKYVEQNKSTENELPQPTQAWMVGGDQGGRDIKFLDNYVKGNSHFWQGNIDTKRGDIIIMYCLAPRSYIHSIWRATSDGIADPFFHFYSNIYIGEGIKVAPVTLNQLKTDEYFSNHPLVRKNLQGVSGYPINSDEYNRLLQMIIKNGGTIEELPKLYSPTFSSNQNLKVERDVEVILIEPLLKELGYLEEDWVRQLPVRMGRGERNFPDYAFLNNKEKNYESASMLIEAKFWIKNNKELEETFRQTYSYGLRLNAKILVIADKEAIWIYERRNESFDRSMYIKKYWKELEQPDEFNFITKLIGKK